MKPPTFCSIHAAADKDCSKKAYGQLVQNTKRTTVNNTLFQAARPASCDRPTTYRGQS